MTATNEMSKSERIARKAVASLSTEEIVKQFELTELVNEPEISIVRGWYMDELESRNPEAFEKWLDAYTESPREFFLK